MLYFNIQKKGNKRKQPDISKLTPLSALCYLSLALLGLFFAHIWRDIGAFSGETRAQKLYKQVRCPTCQSQSIAESDGPTARAMRLYINDQIRRGQSDQETLKSLQKAYGAFILMKPEASGPAWIFWLAPLFPLGAIVVYRVIKR